MLLSVPQELNRKVRSMDSDPHGRDMCLLFYEGKSESKVP